jgi:hypothetical protein
MQKRNLFTLLFISVFIMFSCGENPDQTEFEKEAHAQPSGYSQTDDRGNIVNDDPDDWRIAPRFSGDIEFSLPPYPNPSVTQTIRFEMLIGGLNSIYGASIYVRRTNGTYKILRSNRQAPLPTGLIQFNIDPLELSQDFELYQIDNLYRIFIYDNNENLITYGDIKIGQVE